MDNAAGHVGEETYNDIVEALQLAQIYLYFLPAYSPELDTAEFVFHEIKRKVKKHKDGDKRLWIDTIMACAWEDVWILAEGFVWLDKRIHVRKYVYCT